MSLSVQGGPALSRGLALVFFIISMVFVRRSFYGMRIQVGVKEAGAAASKAA